MMISSRTWRVVACLAALTMLAAACSDDDDSGDSTTTSADDATTTTGDDDGPAPDAVTITGSDYKYEGVPEELSAGQELTFVNESTIEVHELVALKLPEGETRDIEELVTLQQDELDLLFGSGPPAAVLIALPGDGRDQHAGRRHAHRARSLHPHLRHPGGGGRRGLYASSWPAHPPRSRRTSPAARRTSAGAQSPRRPSPSSSAGSPCVCRRWARGKGAAEAVPAPITPCRRAPSRAPLPRPAFGRADDRRPGGGRAEDLARRHARRGLRGARRSPQLAPVVQGHAQGSGGRRPERCGRPPHGLVWTGPRPGAVRGVAAGPAPDVRRRRDEPSGHAGHVQEDWSLQAHVRTARPSPSASRPSRPVPCGPRPGCCAGSCAGRHTAPPVSPTCSRRLEP